MKELLFSEISSERVAAMELGQGEYALDISSPSLLLKANLDGLRCHFESLINYDPRSRSKFKERLLRTKGHQSFYCKDAQLAYDACLGSNTLVLGGCLVKEGSSLQNSVVASNAIISESCIVHNSMIGPGSEIKSNSVVKNSIISAGCWVGEGCQISDCIVQSDSKIEPGTKLNSSIIDKTGKVQENLSRTEINKYYLQDELEIEPEYTEEQEESEEDEEAFATEVKDLVLNAVEKGYSAEDVAKEMISMKLNKNKPVKECLKAASKAVFGLLVSRMKEAQRDQLGATIKDTLQQWKPLLSKFLSSEEEVFFIDTFFVE